MNMAKLRQILELRRATKMPPLLPPKKGKRAQEELMEKRSTQKEILDIHLQLRNLEIGQNAAAGCSTTIACAFSESEETQRGPWRMTTANELPVDECSVDLRNVVAVEFQLERVRFLRLDICDLFGQQKEAFSFGYCIFSVSEMVCSRGGRIQRKLINDETGAEIAEAIISCTLRPKAHAVVLQFAGSHLSRKGIGNSAMAQVFFEIHRMPSAADGAIMEQQSGGTSSAFSNGTMANADSGEEAGNSSGSGGTSPKGSLLYRSEGIKWNSSRLLWRTFALQSTDIARRELRLLCFQRDHSKAQTLPPLPLGEFAMHFSVLRRGPGPENVYFLAYEDSRHRKKTSGTFELCRLHEVCTPSFLEYIAAGSALNLAFAVDFSRPETAVEEMAIRHYVDDVELVIGAFGEPLKDFNNANSFAAFGFGAKIPPQFRESQEFCLNLDTDPYCRGLNGVSNAFKTSFSNVQPLNMAHLSHVIYYVAKLAQNSLCRASPAMSGIETDYNPPAYFVLVLITRGVFDDLKETVQAIIFASRAPLSIVFVGIGDDDKELGELERLGTAGTRLNFHGRKPERDCTQYVSVPFCRAEEAKLADLKGLIAEKGLATLSAQMCSWMMRNGYQKAPTDLVEPTTPPTTVLTSTAACTTDNNNMMRRHPPSSPTTMPPGAPHSSAGSLGGLITTTPNVHHHQNSAKMIVRPLEGRGGNGSAQSLSLAMMTSPTSSSSTSSGHASMIGGGTSPTSIISAVGTSTTTNTSSNCSGTSSTNAPMKMPTMTSIQQRFRNLDMNNFAVSLPGSPRRRLPSTISMEKKPAKCGNHQQQKKTQSGGNLLMGTSIRQQHFHEARSLSTSQSSSTEDNGQRISKAKTMTISMNRE